MDPFPDHLIQLLKTSKYVHLATAAPDGHPSIALMNYTYIPPHKAYQTDNVAPYIIFGTHVDTEKYHNIVANPHVSLLIHDWVTAKKLSLKKYSNTNTPTEGDVKSQDESGQSRLLSLLQELNQVELSQMSASLRGLAEVVEPDSDESKFYEHVLLKANPDAKCFIQGDDVVIVKVQVERAKISDNENNTSVYE
ncbi:pyridoxal 5'-phosphate synthase Ecym_2803 [Eremothecium cymbalariae DBVPG|uniref:Pyridoxamine 5'-phosphate oxidase N-terminal domain-containing protein n=1 Tax=Eremothecium cymbalariae (strain CBS 270.75 / DBVPG 7215 / KCTC 17166 / NRRL Y-17582) TaxID=931890 RepID=G8JQD7_ERECY|nr:Hypothetical protein Ecym_2803 [Eremothecium cymbalariae DBVPG\